MNTIDSSNLQQAATSIAQHCSKHSKGKAKQSAIVEALSLFMGFSNSNTATAHGKSLLNQSKHTSTLKQEFQDEGIEFASLPLDAESIFQLYIKEQDHSFGVYIEIPREDYEHYSLEDQEQWVVDQMFNNKIHPVDLEYRLLGIDTEKGAQAKACVHVTGKIDIDYIKSKKLDDKISAFEESSEVRSPNGAESTPELFGFIEEKMGGITAYIEQSLLEDLVVYLCKYEPAMNKHIHQGHPDWEGWSTCGFDVHTDTMEENLAECGGERPSHNIVFKDKIVGLSMTAEKTSWIESALFRMDAITSGLVQEISHLIGSNRNDDNEDVALAAAVNTALINPVSFDTAIEIYNDVIEMGNNQHDEIQSPVVDSLLIRLQEMSPYDLQDYWREKQDEIAPIVDRLRS